MALDVPIVSTNCPSGPSEIVTSPDYGVLVEMGDIKQMVEAIVHFLGQSKRKVGLASERVRKLNNIDQITMMYLDVFRGNQ